MGYAGKVVEQEQARTLRAQGWTYAEICAELGVARSSVSLWCRDVAVDPALLDGRRRARYEAGNSAKRPSRLHLQKLADIERCADEARRWLGELSERDLFVAGIALYAGEGFKSGGAVGMANTDPRVIALFLRWLRTFFAIDESRLRVRVYLHHGLDLDEASEFWSDLTGVPLGQFGAPYRAVDNPTRRRSKHPMGCPSVRYSSVEVLRSVLGLTEALLHSTLRGPG